MISRRADWRSAALSLITPLAGGSPGVCHLTYLPLATSPHLPCCLCHVGLSTSPLCWESKAAFMPASFSPVELRSRLPPLCSWFELCECCNRSPLQTRNEADNWTFSSGRSPCTFKEKPRQTKKVHVRAGTKTTCSFFSVLKSLPVSQTGNGLSMWHHRECCRLHVRPTKWCSHRITSYGEDMENEH